MESILFWPLAVSLFFLLVTSLILLRNRFELTPLPGSDFQPSEIIAICIPARNEEKNIARILDTVCRQDHPDFHVHVLDDESDDATPGILEEYQRKYPEILSVHTGKPLPAGWLGKPWACHQLARKTEGDILLFLDADTSLQPGFLQRIEHAFKKYPVDMVTVWPQQIMMSFWEKTVLPIVYHALLTILPAIYVYRKPRWMPSGLYGKFSPILGVACGQCIAFKRNKYEDMGGHATVKNEVLEDVKIAQNARRHGLRLRMFFGADSIQCRMYRSEPEIFEGLRKNLLAGFKDSVILLLLTGLFFLMVFVLPFAAIIYALAVSNAAIFFLSAAIISLILLHRLLIALWFGMDPVFAFTHPLGILWYVRLTLVKISDRVQQRKSTWKGREV